MSTNPKEKTETIAALSLARDLLAKPDGWCQGTLASDVDSLLLEVHDKHAVRFCMLGAMLRVTGLHIMPDNLEEPLLRVIGKDAYDDAGIPDFNDDHDTSQADVLAAFDLAIELVREEA